ncbi:unnamed protein product [Periconia digitata]|uniref:Uncharacterized protein n=1 Tax=Periconia digitata TaxID=1303443 RepID=A0A9W4U1S0_9PLEO|nr:unnamed protein product [Periconia digitata]
MRPLYVKISNSSISTSKIHTTPSLLLPKHGSVVAQFKCDTGLLRFGATCGVTTSLISDRKYSIDRFYSHR